LERLTLFIKFSSLTKKKKKKKQLNIHAIVFEQ